MKQTAMLPKERSVIRRRTLQSVIGLSFVLALAAGLSSVERPTLSLLAVSFGLILLPVWGELQIKLHTYLAARHADEVSKSTDCSFQDHFYRHNTAKALRTVLTAAFALSGLVSFGGLSLIGYDIGPAISPVQIGLIGLAILPAITATLLWDKPDAHRIKQAWRDRLTGRAAIWDFSGFGLLAAALSYGNFLYFFTRNDISPSFMAMDTPLFLQATTVAWVTLTVCLLVQLYFERINTHEAVVSDYLTQNRLLLIGTGMVLVSILVVTYVPLLASITRSAPLGLVDWLMVLLAGTSFCIIRLLQRHTRKHTRHHVVALHRQIHG